MSFVYQFFCGIGRWKASALAVWSVDWLSQSTHWIYAQLVHICVVWIRCVHTISKRIIFTINCCEIYWENTRRRSAKEANWFDFEFDFQSFYHNMKPNVETLNSIYNNEMLIHTEKCASFYFVSFFNRNQILTKCEVNVFYCIENK